TLSGVVRGAAAPLTLVRIARLCRAGGEFSALPKTFPPVSVGKDREASFFDTLHARIPAGIFAGKPLDTTASRLYNIARQPNTL
ncbi:MAG: hypothetical protein PUD63_05140, partial [Clostridia bacterium]|nr:hypothetical protein [Clostridia bacterium]